MVVEVYVSGTIFKIPNSWMPRVVALLTSLQAFVDVPDDVRVEVKLVSVGPNPIKIIAEIRAITGKSLNEAKKLMIDPPKGRGASLGRFSYERAEEIRRRIAEAGGSVTFPHPLKLLGDQADATAPVT